MSRVAVVFQKCSVLSRSAREVVFSTDGAVHSKLLVLKTSSGLQKKNCSSPEASTNSTLF